MKKFALIAATLLAGGLFVSPAVAHECSGQGEDGLDGALAPIYADGDDATMSGHIGIDLGDGAFAQASADLDEDGFFLEVQGSDGGDTNGVQVSDDEGVQECDIHADEAE